MRQILISVSVFFAVFSIAYSETSYDVVATGDHSVWIITNDIKDMFIEDTGLTMKLIPELAIAGKGCQKGISHAAGGAPSRDVGLVCCDLNPDDIRKNNLKIYPFAKEPLAIIVNNDNPVKGLSLTQVRDIFSGRITNWKDVGGKDDKIVVLTQLHCQSHTPNWTGILKSPGEFTKNRLDIKTQPEMAKTVADFKEAIGHLEMTSVLESKQDIRVLPINGFMPTSENMKKGLYPIFGPLSLVTSGGAEGNVLTFIDYLRKNRKVAKAMEKYGMSQTE